MKFEKIEEFLCSEMDIKRFRDAGEEIGLQGVYVDFWHLWLDIVKDDVTNGETSIVKREFINNYFNDARKKYQWCIEKGLSDQNDIELYFDFIQPIFEKAWNALFDKYGDTIEVYYFW